jgi:flavodoxin
MDWKFSGKGIEKMKRFRTLFLSIFLLLSMAGCGNSSLDAQAEKTADSTQDAQTETASDDAASTQAEAEANVGKTLVVYYSATNHTENVASVIASAANADVFELVPVEEYSSDDLDWTDDNSRVVKEHDNTELRDIELVETNVADWESYDTVFIGYPIWWQIAAWPVDGFVKSNDFSGKTVIPFCTSSSSGIGDSGKLLAEEAGTGDWQEGMRFSSSVSDDEVTEWVAGLGFK